MQESRRYSILFLLQEEAKRVYLEISYAKEKAAILRKHWHGRCQQTQGYFSSKCLGAKPEMLVWEAGFITREKALVFLKKWEDVFSQEGYQIIGSQVKDEKPQKYIRLNSKEEVKLDSITFASLLEGKNVKKIVCGEDGGAKRGAPQKYTVEAAEAIFRVRVTYEVRRDFRKFCKKNGLTQNQGFALLLSYADKENTENYLYQDLRGRLEKADALIAQKEETIQKLNEALQAEKNAKQRPNKVRAAMLQDELLRMYFERLPEPNFSEEQLKRWSKRQSRRVFPYKADYHFPEEEGVYLVSFEHVRYIPNSPGVLMFYGTTEDGEQLKFCYRYCRGEQYGISLWDSPYLVPEYPWGIAVLKPDEIAYIVGALPMFDLDQIESWNVEDEEVLDPVQNLRAEILSEVDEELARMNREWANLDQTDEQELDWEDDASIERKIEIAEAARKNGKFKK